MHATTPYVLVITWELFQHIRGIKHMKGILIFVASVATLAYIVASYAQALIGALALSVR